MIRQETVKYINEQCEAIEQKSVTNTTKDLYRKVKNLTRKCRPTVYKTDQTSNTDGNYFVKICTGEMTIYP